MLVIPQVSESNVCFYSCIHASINQPKPPLINRTGFLSVIWKLEPKHHKPQKPTTENENENENEMGLTMGLNMLLLLAMVATNLLSLYYLSSSSSTFLQFRHPTTSPPPVPDHLLQQLHTIRATINHLTRLQPTTTPKPTAKSTIIPSDLLIYTRISPVASACRDHPELLHRYMNYSPFSLCPPDPTNRLAETLILNGCHPLPRRRCFSLSPAPPPSLSSSSHPFSPLPNAWSAKYSNLGFDMKSEKEKFIAYKSDLDLPISQLLHLSRSSKSPIRIGLDIGGGTGTFAARMKLEMNATVITTTMNLGAPYNEAAAARGLVPLHVPLQQRLPVYDGDMDQLRCGRAVNRWIPTSAMELMLFDVDRVLRGGGYLWLDRIFSKGVDLDKVYGPLIGRLGYKKVKWAVAKKSDSSGVKNGEVYLTALLQKPLSR